MSVNISWLLKMKYNKIKKQKANPITCLYLDMTVWILPPQNVFHTRMAPSHQRCQDIVLGSTPQDIRYHWHCSAGALTTAEAAGTTAGYDGLKDGMEGGRLQLCLGGQVRRAERMEGDLGDRRGKVPDIFSQGKGRSLADMSTAERMRWGPLCGRCGLVNTLWTVVVGGPYVILMLHTPSCVFLGGLLNLSVPQVFSSVKSE